MSNLIIKKTITTIILIILTLSTISLFSGCIEKKETNSDENLNNPPYNLNLTFTLLNGSEKNLSDYQGKYVLLDFMGANCQPCQYEMFVLEDINNEYKNKDLEIISIDVWIVYGETIELVNDMIDQYNQQGVSLDWTFGVDDNQGTLFNKYASNGVPMIYLLDKNGNIYYQKGGYTDYQTLASKIDELIND